MRSRGEDGRKVLAMREGARGGREWRGNQRGEKKRSTAFLPLTHGSSINRGVQE